MIETPEGILRLRKEHFEGTFNQEVEGLNLKEDNEIDAVMETRGEMIGGVGI